MAWHEFDEKSGFYRIRFRYAGRKFNLSKTLKITDERDAQSKCDEAERTIALLGQGILTVPDGIDLGEFIVSGGRLNQKPIVASPAKAATLGTIFAQFIDEMSGVIGRESTLKTERINIKHLSDKALLGNSKRIDAIVFDDIQGYVGKRGKQTWQGKTIKRATIEKEIETLRLIWGWALKRNRITSPVPFEMKDLTFDKTPEKPEFSTFDQINRKIGRGGMTDAEKDELWDSLYLTDEHVADVLDHVKALDAEPFIYPMFVFVAMTGARRGELVRSEIDDFDFEGGTVTLRGTKGTKARKTEIIKRKVKLFSRLREVMASWFKNHPGGQHTLCHVDGRPLTVNMATHHFNSTLDGCIWSVIKGFHVFRHSFASILASKGADQRIIDSWMGHQTEEMRRRYQHLFPTPHTESIDLLPLGRGE